MNIPNFDLNLLRVFDMLLREQNVSHAAERLVLTQPTICNPLPRLQDTLGVPRIYASAGLFDVPVQRRGHGSPMCKTEQTITLTQA